MEYQELNIKAQNIKNHCCTCLNELIGYKYEIDDLAPALLAIFQQYTDYGNVNIGLYPNCICAHCHEKLQLIDDFQKSSQKSMQFLEELIRSFQSASNSALARNECEEKEICSSFVDTLLQPEKPELNSENVELGDPLLCNNSFEQFSIKTEINEGDFEISERKVDLNEAAPPTDDQQKTSNDSPENIGCLQCKKCAFNCSKKHQLKYHMKRVHKSNLAPKILCKFGCEKSFRLTLTAEKHYQQMHHGEGKEIPKKGVISAEVLSLKKKIKEKLQELGCALKTEANQQDGGVNDNIDSLASSTSKTTCQICLKNFCSVSGLNVHMRIHLDERPFQCDQCDRGFNKRALLTHHIREVHTDVPLEIVCKFGCGRIFQRQQTAMNHYRVKHVLPEQGIKRDYKRVCEDCGKVFKNISVLKEHRNIHLAPEERPYPCDQCNKRFSMKKSLTIHLARHAGIRNFECKICGLKTITSNELRIHMNVHTQERRFECPLCSKAFNSYSNMKRHEQVVHQGLKKYNCRFCNESFGKPDTLKHHEMRHTGERPHKCETCGRAFIQSVALKAHMKTHKKSTKLLLAEETPENMLS